jgi:hydroxymethylpyrimidine/phosphomethylpyrimidine kinase
MDQEKEERFQMKSNPPASVLTIAGSDSGGGAGIQADLKTFCAHDAYGCSVLTAVTAQNTVGVRQVHQLPVELVTAQLEAVMQDLQPKTVKIGMLANAQIVQAVAASLRQHKPSFVVLDPVMLAKSGDALLAEEAVSVLRSELFPLATLVTPNLPEAERLSGLPVTTEEEIEAAARHLAGGSTASDGPAVLIKGGHGKGEEVLDLLLADGERHDFRHPRLVPRAIHGTGCTLSSAIACRLTWDLGLLRAVEGGIDYLVGAMRQCFPAGRGHQVLDHMHEVGF